jgi:hypothetical protein
MSYDIWLEADLGGTGAISVGTLDWNYTSNCARMWRQAMPETDGLAGMHGMLAGDAAKVLRNGITHMTADPGAYRAMNPENGWGDYDSQLFALRELLGAFDAAPRAKVAISR